MIVDFFSRFEQNIQSGLLTHFDSIKELADAIYYYRGENRTRSIDTIDNTMIDLGEVFRNTIVIILAGSCVSMLIFAYEAVVFNYFNKSYSN